MARAQQLLVRSDHFSVSQISSYNPSEHSRIHGQHKTSSNPSNLEGDVEVVISDIMYQPWLLYNIFLNDRVRGPCAV